MSNNIIEIRDLRIHFNTDEGVVKAVDGVSLDIKRNRTLGLIGESGCGKSVMARSILKLIEFPGKIVSGSIQYNETGEEGEAKVDICALKERSKMLHSIRGNKIAMIFQEPMSAFGPLNTVGNQIIETIRLHQKVDKKVAKRMTVELLSDVGIPEPEQTINAYPHELSGGMCQRVMIAMALSCQPALLIADEPTTAIDVTIQSQILHLIRSLKSRNKMSLLFITHDLGVISQMADEIAVMYLGKIVEYAPARELFSNPQHPYTRALIRSIPGMTGEITRLESIKGNVPSPINVPPGCVFRARCEEKTQACDLMNDMPATVHLTEEHSVCCHKYV